MTDSLTLQDIIRRLNLKVLTAEKDFAAVTPTGGYASDLLSCVMAGAKQNELWLTLQAHTNVVAVAALLDLCAVVITEGVTPDAATIEKANEQGVTLLSTPLPTYAVCGELWNLGLRQD